MAWSTEANPTTPAIGGAVRLGFYVLMGALALMEVFVSFRGLRSPAGMEQAQLAREVARGQGWVTQCIRPAAWKQALQANPEGVDLGAFPDTGTAPLPALVLAPLFKLAEPWWEFDPGRDGVVYGLDRVVAGTGVIWLLLLIYHLHGLAMRLFDERVAVVAAAAAGFCKPLWALAASGSPRMLLGLGLVAGLRLVVSVVEGARQGAPVGGRLAGLGLVAAAMAMTHGLGLVWAVVLMAGVWVAMRGSGGMGRGGLAALVAPLLAAAGWWMWRNHGITGEVMGAAKLVLRGLISGVGEDEVARRFADSTEGMVVPQVLRVMGLRLAGQMDGVWGHLGLNAAAPLVVLAWLHRFRRPICDEMARLAGVLLAASMAAMALTGPVEELMDEHNLFIVLAPVMGIFGTAMVTMAWSRLHPGRREFWPAWGQGVILVGLTALPLVVSLPDTIRGGLALRGRLSQWPPYAADRVARVGTLVEENEVVMADAPWFTAWYADVPSVWLPSRRADLGLMREEAEKAGRAVAGVVVTPVSAQGRSLGQVLEGPWSDWPDVVFRGPMLAFDREMKAWPDFPYPVAVPLVGFSLGEGEGLGLLMAFYTDRMRTPRKGG